MRLEAREYTPLWLPWVAILSSGLITLIFAAILIMVVGASPVTGFYELLKVRLALKIR